MKTIQISLYLDKELHLALKVRAAQKDVNMSALARTLIAKGLDEDKANPVEIPKKEAIAP